MCNKSQGFYQGQVQSRPTVEEYFMNLVFHVASRGSCARRKVGCILTNHKNHIIGTGYNGRHSGAVECLEIPCSGAGAPSGQSLDKCEAIHAEQNALLQCKDVYEISVAYVTTSPCIQCVKLLLNTSCHTIVYAEEYPHTESRQLWENAGRNWVQADGIRSYSEALQNVRIDTDIVY